MAISIFTILYILAGLMYFTLGLLISKGEGTGDAPWKIALQAVVWPALSVLFAYWLLLATVQGYRRAR